MQKTAINLPPVLWQLPFASCTAQNGSRQEAARLGPTMRVCHVSYVWSASLFSCHTAASCEVNGVWNRCIQKIGSQIAMRLLVGRLGEAWLS